MDKADVLGTQYKIEMHKISEDEHMKKNIFMGYCLYDEKLIVIADTSEKEYFHFDNEYAQTNFRDKILRHELVHAFLYESGLSECCEWTANETIIDWIALQVPKMVEVFMKLECI